MRRIALAACIVAVSAPSFADWFARLDESGKLQVTAIAQDPDDVLSAFYIDCGSSKGTLKLVIETRQNSNGSDEYHPTQIDIAVNRLGAEKNDEFSVHALPLTTPTHILAYRSELDEVQSLTWINAMLQSHRIDFQFRSDELIHEEDPKRIFNSGSLRTGLALADACGIEAKAQ